MTSAPRDYIKREGIVNSAVLALLKPGAGEQGAGKARCGAAVIIEVSWKRAQVTQNWLVTSPGASSRPL